MNTELISLGDKVTVEGKVSDNNKSMRNFLVTFSDAQQYWVPYEDIATHTPAPPKPLKVGDKVMHTQDSRMLGEILAIDEDQAWVKWRHNLNPYVIHRESHSLCNLERIAQ